ncbi:glycosyltransferase [Helicobacter sp. MIT 14-3879]|uniref:glycosyltransferase family 8 protein n=1 Tax=Helicobacter sp. MIT 14-3879 TaxID=2040649 RepID=UPI000E1F57B0|nr:glycosyltransferase [Helicobacter sp. MIT 14-3879]RDU65198.1 hypothetical protein CQA44_02470 [Helicobacter sp. MIT 14-3879]
MQVSSLAMQVHKENISSFAMQTQYDNIKINNTKHKSTNLNHKQKSQTCLDTLEQSFNPLNTKEQNYDLNHTEQNHTLNTEQNHALNTEQNHALNPIEQSPTLNPAILSPALISPLNPNLDLCKDCYDTTKHTNHINPINLTNPNKDCYANPTSQTELTSQTSPINPPNIKEPSSLNPTNRAKLFYKLYVIHNDVSDDFQNLLIKSIAEFSDFASLEFINANDTFSTEWESLGLQAHFSKEFLYKLLLDSYFREYEKIIISDVDVVFLGDVSRSFLAFQSDAYIAGVRANNPDCIYPLEGWKSGYKKFSEREFEAIKYGVGGGYLIANLKAWRRDGLESKLINYLKANASKLVLAEQDVLNVVCYPHIATLSPAHIVWNGAWEHYGEHWEGYIPEVYSREELDNARLSPIQLHYIGDNKPWKKPSVPKSEIWYSYLANSPFMRLHLLSIERAIIDDYIKTTIMYRIKRLFKTKPLFMFDVRFYLKLCKKIYKKTKQKLSRKR